MSAANGGGFGSGNTEDGGPSSRYRVRVLFIDCPNLDVAAASQLVLSQNSVQDVIQFEVCHHWIYSSSEFDESGLSLSERVVEWWAGKSFAFSGDAKRRLFSRWDRLNPDIPVGEVDLNSCTKIYGEVVAGYDRWLQRKSEWNFDIRPCPTVVVTDTPISGGYFCQSDGGVGVVSTAQWRHISKPVSALDYVLAIVQRVSLRLIFPVLDSHYATRGCIWDFSPHQRDVRISILLGHICETCRDRLLVSSSYDVVEKISLLISRRWVGDRDVQFSPASVLAHVYSYDLSRSTGLSSTFSRRVLGGFEPELGKILSEAVKWSLVIVLTAVMASCFPGVLKGIKENISVGSPARESEGAGNLVPLGAGKLNDVAVLNGGTSEESVRFHARMLGRRLDVCVSEER